MECSNLSEQGFHPIFLIFQFSSLLTREDDARIYTQGEVTIFAPSDDAMGRYEGSKDARFVMNHMGEIEKLNSCTYGCIGRVGKHYYGSYLLSKQTMGIAAPKNASTNLPLFSDGS